MQSLLFKVLGTDDNNYLGWRNDAKAYLAADKLDGIVEELDAKAYLVVEELKEEIVAVASTTSK